jgi:hypothetical protein
VAVSGVCEDGSEGAEVRGGRLGVAFHLSNTIIRTGLRNLGLPEPEPGKLHLLGVRGAVPHGTDAISLRPNVPDAYNDTLCVFGVTFGLFLASTDPGAHWTAHPSNPRGAAHLLPGCYLYQKGIHKGRPALVQAAGVDVRRDSDRDGKAEPHEPIQRGVWIGLNIHAGGATPSVGAWSAGCQVVKGGWGGKPWLRFWDLIEQSGKDRFRYWLVDGEAFARAVGAL